MILMLLVCWNERFTLGWFRRLSSGGMRRVVGCGRQKLRSVPVRGEGRCPRHADPKPGGSVLVHWQSGNKVRVSWLG